MKDRVDLSEIERSIFDFLTTERSKIEDTMYVLKYSLDLTETEILIFKLQNFLKNDHRRYQLFIDKSSRSFGGRKINI